MISREAGLWFRVRRPGTRSLWVPIPNRVLRQRQHVAGAESWEAARPVSCPFCWPSRVHRGTFLHREAGEGGGETVGGEQRLCHSFAHHAGWSRVFGQWISLFFFRKRLPSFSSWGCAQMSRPTGDKEVARRKFQLPEARGVRPSSTSGVKLDRRCHLSLGSLAHCNGSALSTKRAARWHAMRLSAIRTEMWRISKLNSRRYLCGQLSIRLLCGDMVLSRD